MDIFDEILEKQFALFEEHYELTDDYKSSVKLSVAVLVNDIKNLDTKIFTIFTDELAMFYEDIESLYLDNHFAHRDVNYIEELLYEIIYETLNKKDPLEYLNFDLQKLGNLSSKGIQSLFSDSITYSIGETIYRRENICLDNKGLISGEIILEYSHWYYVKDKVCINLDINPQSEEDKLLLKLEYGGNWLRT